jgi:hypothetical protein
MVECLPSKCEALNLKPQYHQKEYLETEHQWLKPIILATLEAEVGRIECSRPTQENSQEIHLQNNQSKMDWKCGSSSRALLCKW